MLRIDDNTNPTPPANMTRKEQEQWLDNFFNVGVDNRWFRQELEQRAKLWDAIEERSDNMPDMVF